MGLNRRHENTMDVRARDWVALRGAGGHVAVPVGALRGGWAWAGAEPGRLRRQTIKYNVPDRTCRPDRICKDITLLIRTRFVPEYRIF